MKKRADSYLKLPTPPFSFRLYVKLAREGDFLKMWCFSRFKPAWFSWGLGLWIFVNQLWKTKGRKPQLDSIICTFLPLFQPKSDLFYLFDFVW